MKLKHVVTNPALLLMQTSGLVASLTQFCFNFIKDVPIMSKLKHLWQHGPPLQYRLGCNMIILFAHL